MRILATLIVASGIAYWAWHELTKPIDWNIGDMHARY